MKAKSHLVLAVLLVLAVVMGGNEQVLALNIRTYGSATARSGSSSPIDHLKKFTTTLSIMADDDVKKFNMLESSYNKVGFKTLGLSNTALFFAVIGIFLAVLCGLLCLCMCCVCCIAASKQNNNSE